MYQSFNGEYRIVKNESRSNEGMEVQYKPDQSHGQWMSLLSVIIKQFQK